MARLADLPAGRGAELGCGAGRHARWLAGRGWSMQASDVSAVAIDLATAADTSTRYEVGDARTWAPAGEMDLVLVAYLHLPVPDLVTALRRSTGWLVPGGRLLYVGHAAEDRDRGAGRPGEPGIAPTIGDLAAAAAEMRVRELAHHVGLVGEGTLDIVLYAERWT